MKENINIDELFKQKFDGFQPEVDPSVWANVQAGIGAGTAVATGVSVGVKIGLISTGIIAASVATWYFGFYEPQTPVQNTTQQTVVSATHQDETVYNEPIIVVNDQNDPAIIENKDQIEKELRNYQTTQQVSSEVVNPVNGNPVVLNVPNNGGSEVNGGSPTTIENPVNGGSETVVLPDDKKDKVPSGRMEFSQAALYAPSNVSFVSNALNFNKVRWDFGDGVSAEGAEAKHTYNKPGKYVVKMTVVGDKTTYEESQELIVKSRSSIDNVPNVITPNGDRINDYFSIKTTDVETFYITITDNRGNEIFTSNDKDFSWDGTDFSGQTVEKGLYTYVIIAEGKDGSVIKLPGQIYVQ